MILKNVERKEKNTAAIVVESDAAEFENAVNSAYPTLMRPVDLVPQRYNQQLTPGSLIVEVGSSGNTLREALAAIRLFGLLVWSPLSNQL